MRENLNPEPDVGKIKKYLTHMDAEIYVFTRIIDDMLMFGKRKAPYLAKININDILRNSVERVNVLANIELVLELEDNIPEVLADESQIRLVLLNIVMNALQVMPEEGNLTVASTKKEESVEIKVSDTGEGITPPNLEKIFDPLFSTKFEGTGLGLSVCREIVLAHKGTINAESEVGKGTTVSITLPL